MPPTVQVLPAELCILTVHANGLAPQARCNPHRQRYIVNAKHCPAPSRQPVGTQAAKEAHIPAVTPAPEIPTWDPEGLLSRVPASGGHFAERERKQPAGGSPASPGAAYPPAGSSNAFKAQLRNHVTPIAEELPQRGGIPAAERDLYDKTSLTHSLEQDYLPVNMDQPGLSIQSLEPPVFTVDNFMTSEECQQLAQAAEATGLLKQSKIGEGNVESGAVSVNERRTSSTVLLEPTVVEQNAELQPMVVQLQAKAQKLLDIGGWTAAGRLPPPGQFCFESLQVACYQPGQHFLQHEDAFPPNFVRQNRFQRQATLLVYLNDVDQGGMTHFDRLGVSIKPQCGKALLFFPAFSDGTPDPRTVHTAQSPDSVKWVTQVWIAGGHPRNGPSHGMSAVTSSSSDPLASSTPSSASPAAVGTDDDLEGRILSTR
ncbi:MAG: PBCV-1 prolyl 4-hydroxylase (ISS) [Trebouxia sp. A1-2]|nr:MAG: PBCV-1 prolyl 4-hydroxylase (ISS) [Trebouxia sp. A1-2]